MNKSASMSSDTSMMDARIDELKPRAFNKLGILWTGSLVVLCALGLYFYVQQYQDGLGITGMRDYSTWGIYISNFVFFVAISLVGSLISSILKLSGASWANPLTRIAEFIAVAAIIFAGIVIIVDMGRPDRFLNVIVYGRVQSPITWDVIVISTYLMLSLLFLYLPLIPDLALLNKRSSEFPKWQSKLYKILSINWVGKSSQKTILGKSINIIAIMIIPVAFGIHTVTSWLFATTFRPGWDSTNFGPYFVSGAFMAGAAAVIIAMYIFRRYYKLKDYLTDLHFDKMAKLLVLLSMVYLYFNINEYFIPAYKMKGNEVAHLEELLYGENAVMFWSVQFFGMILPIIILLFKKGRKPLIVSIVAIMVLVGAWYKRFLIVIPTLAHPLIPTDRVPDELLKYSPTMPEWFITIGTLAGSLLIITILARIFPIIPIEKNIHLKSQS